MKKKIKDLTWEDANKICDNGGKYLPCDRCPLSLGRLANCCYKTFLFHIHKKRIDLDEEVEIK